MHDDDRDVCSVITRTVLRERTCGSLYCIVFVNSNTVVCHLSLSL